MARHRRMRRSRRRREELHIIHVSGAKRRLRRKRFVVPKSFRRQQGANARTKDEQLSRLIRSVPFPFIVHILA